MSALRYYRAGCRGLGAARGRHTTAKKRTRSSIYRSKMDGSVFCTPLLSDGGDGDESFDTSLDAIDMDKIFMMEEAVDGSSLGAATYGFESNTHLVPGTASLSMPIENLGRQQQPTYAVSYGSNSEAVVHLLSDVGYVSGSVNVQAAPTGCIPGPPPFDYHWASMAFPQPLGG